MSISAFSSCGKNDLLRAVESNDLEGAALLIAKGADVNARMIDEEKLKSAHDMLTSSVTAKQINDISHISIPYDVTSAIIYAVCLIACDDMVKPDMTYLQVWYVVFSLILTLDCLSCLMCNYYVANCGNMLPGTTPKRNYSALFR
jgi:hypothetical protein